MKPSAWDTIKRWAPTVAIVAGLILLCILTLGRGVRVDQIVAKVQKTRDEERESVAAAQAAHEQAVREIEEAHRKTIENLTAAQRAEAESLRSDPKQLTSYLVRVGAKLAVLLALGASTPGWGQPKGPPAPQVTCAPGFPTRCATDLAPGQPAPFQGQLLTPDLAIVLGQTAEGCGPLTEAELKRERDLAAADKKRDQAVTEAERRASDEIAKFKDSERDKASNASTVREVAGLIVILALTVALVAK